MATKVKQISSGCLCFGLKGRNYEPDAQPPPFPVFPLPPLGNPSAAAAVDRTQDEDLGIITRSPPSACFHVILFRFVIKSAS